MLVVGDVRSVKESVFTPCYEILKSSISNLPSSLRNHAARSSDNLTSELCEATRSLRPCIVVKGGIIESDGKTTASICLTTTFNRDPISAMPRIFDHFCVPISPHELIPANRYREQHVHSMPQEWPRDNGWVIAWPMKISRPIGGPWVEKVNGESQTDGPEWFFGKRAVALLRHECIRKRTEWLEKCKDPDTACALAEEVYVSGASSSLIHAHSDIESLA